MSSQQCAHQSCVHLNIKETIETRNSDKAMGSPARNLQIRKKKYFSTILRWGRILWRLIVWPHNVWCHLDIHINRLEQTHNTFDYFSCSRTRLCQIINMIPCCINHKMKFQIFALWIGFQAIAEVTTIAVKSKLLWPRVQILWCYLSTPNIIKTKSWLNSDVLDIDWWYLWYDLCVFCFVDLYWLTHNKLFGYCPLPSSYQCIIKVLYSACNALCAIMLMLIRVEFKFPII